MNASCRACGTTTLVDVFDVGRVTPCNQFPRAPLEPDFFDFAIGMCALCSLVQTVRGPDADAIVPHVPWLSYRMRSDHVAELVSLLEESLPLEGARFLGIGPFDEELLRETAARGHVSDALIRDAPARDLPGDRYPYLETMSGRLVDDVAAYRARRDPEPDVVVCRGLLAHCPRPTEAVRALLDLVGPEGALVLEVSDAARFLAAGEACCLWEEHLSYFTEASLRRLLERVAGKRYRLQRYPGDLGDALVAIVRPDTPRRVEGPIPEIAAEAERYARFRALAGRVLARAEHAPRDAAIYGAGRRGIAALRLYGFGARVRRVFDDDKHKIGRYIPGLAEPIAASRELAEDRTIATCVLAVHPRAEARALERLAPFLARGGRCVSLHAASRLPRLVEAPACA